ncbi:MAG: nitroreductase [Planctomycetota bacterium]|nr:nitroreductase [Planctomycetota bacterium]
MINLEQITELIEHRRTIKPIDAGGEPNYLDKSIPPKTLEQLLENANWAPTHGLTEPWRFTIFQDDARANLASKLSQTYTQHLLPAHFSQTKHDKLIAYAKHTSAAIALGMQRHVGKIPVEEEVIAVACAVQNLHLAATAAQLGGFWSTSPIYDLPEMRDYFGFTGPEDRCLGIFYLGYPKNQWPTRKRTAPDDIRKKTNWRN